MVRGRSLSILEMGAMGWPTGGSGTSGLRFVAGKVTGKQTMRKLTYTSVISSNRSVLKDC